MVVAKAGGGTRTQKEVFKIVNACFKIVNAWFRRQIWFVEFNVIDFFLLKRNDVLM